MIICNITKTIGNSFVYLVVMCLNSLPPTQGISDKHSPIETVTRSEIYFTKH